MVKIMVYTSSSTYMITAWCLPHFLFCTHTHTYSFILSFSLSLSLSLMFFSFIFIGCIVAHCKLATVACDSFCIFLFPRWMAMIFHASIKKVSEQRRKLIPLSVCITYNTAGMWSRLSMFLLPCGEFPGLQLSLALYNGELAWSFVNCSVRSFTCLLPPRFLT